MTRSAIPAPRRSFRPTSETPIVWLEPEGYHHEYEIGGQAPMNWLQQNAAEVIDNGLKVLLAVMATLTVIWQLRKQHRNSLAQQRENARQALMLRIYETLVLRIRALSDANIDAKMYAFGILSSVDIVQRGQTAGYQLSPMTERAPTFSDLNSKAARQLAELITEFECWSIAFPGLNVFQVALNAAAYSVRQSFPPLFESLLHVLPMDPPPGQAGKPTIIHPPPSQEASSELKRLVLEYKEAMDEIDCYIQDLTIEAQNNLLHGLFERRVPPRQPLDPQHRVISTIPEKAQVLIRYFETETPWGKCQAAINAEVIAEVQAKAAVRSGVK
ncbi:MAG: hypothetical protein NTW28_35485 [Candidatus Solibacter sp.]|nr:hypothetical protein [Candidatus Solibacter sp.]